MSTTTTPTTGPSAGASGADLLTAWLPLLDPLPKTAAAVPASLARRITATAPAPRTTARPAVRPQAVKPPPAKSPAMSANLQPSPAVPTKATSGASSGTTVGATTGSSMPRVKRAQYDAPVVSTDMAAMVSRGANTTYVWYP